MDTLVLDIETKKTFHEIGRDTQDYSLLGVSLVGVYSYKKDEYIAFRDGELSALEELLRNVGQVVGFNLYGFDYPVLQGHLDFDFSTVETVDIMDDIKRVMGRRISLNDVAGTTLGVQKSGDGLKAVQFYHQKRWEELEKYCLDDVRITKELFDFGKKNRYIKIPANYGTTEKNIPVLWRLLSANFSPSPTRQSQEKLL